MCQCVVHGQSDTFSAWLVNHCNRIKGRSVSYKYVHRFTIRKNIKNTSAHVYSLFTKNFMHTSTIYGALHRLYNIMFHIFRGIVHPRFFCSWNDTQNLLKVTNNATIRSITYGFLLAFHSNSVALLCSKILAENRSETLPRRTSIRHPFRGCLHWNFVTRK